MSVAKKVFKGILATDKTDNNWTNYIYPAPTKTGPGKKPPRLANRYLDIDPDTGSAKNECPKGLTVRMAASRPAASGILQLSVAK